MEEQYQTPGAREQARQKQEAAKSSWTLSYRLKGLAAGILMVLAYAHWFATEYDWKILLAGAIVGYFLGWLVGSFFYTSDK